LQIPLKETIGAKREEIGGETEGDFMDNSITPKQGMGDSIVLKTGIPKCFSVGGVHLI
jgi:hypothetical protein